MVRSSNRKINANLISRIVTERGSDATAASGGERELSEWQRSIADESGNAEEDIGHRNRLGK